MKQNNLTEANTNERIVLTFSEKFSYFSISIGLLGFSLLFGYLYISILIKKGSFIFDFYIIFMLVLLILSITFFYILNIKLRLVKINTQISMVNLLDIINKMYAEENYNILMSEENMLVCESFYNPGFNSIEELLTIIIHKDKLHINFRTTTGGKGVLFDYGIAKKHLEQLKQELQNASR